MTTEQGLYSKVVKLRRKDLKFIAANKFQGLSARSQRWFDLDFVWIKANFSTCETDVYKKLFQRHDDTKDTNTFKIFHAPIRNSKFVETFKFENDSPILRYFQK